MRAKKIRHSVKLDNDIFIRLNKDKKHFQKVIDGGKWSNSDTIREWIKLIDFYAIKKGKK